MGDMMKRAFGARWPCAQCSGARPSSRVFDTQSPSEAPLKSVLLSDANSRSTRERSADVVMEMDFSRNAKFYPSVLRGLWHMNTVRHFNELSHSIFSSKGNCCLRKLGESAFCGRRRDFKFFCHFSNSSLIVKHAQCRKEHLFSGR